MLNDYEIQNISIDKYNKVISILKLIAACLTIVCSIILFPNWIEELKDIRSNDNQNTLKVRVIANSNTIKDQQLKNDIVEDLSPLFFHLQNTEMDYINEEEVVQLAEYYLNEKYQSMKVNVKIGDHLTPPKIQNEIFYPQALYNTLVVTIGEGRGDNFWCSIFPDVCEGPSKNGEKSEDDNIKEEKEVKFLIWEWIKQLFR